MSEHLCISCSMCCDGTLFDYVGVRPEERDQLGSGPEFETVDGRLGMRQPCVRLGADGACSVYMDRPNRCRAFACDLLKSVEAGETDGATASVLVNHAKSLKSQSIELLRAITPAPYHPSAGASPKLWMRALEDAKGAGADVSDETFSKGKHTFMAFAVHLAAHFRDPTQPNTPPEDEQDQA